MKKRITLALSFIGTLSFAQVGINTENQLFKQFQSEFDSTIIRRENTNNSTSKKYDYDLLYKEKGIYFKILIFNLNS